MISNGNKILVFVLLLIATVYFLSPPLFLTVEIHAAPQGIEKFYVETRSKKFGLIHSAGSTVVDKKLVPVNQKVKIPLNWNKMNWLNPIYVSFHHPEYFWDVKQTSNRFFLPKIELTPIAWSDALNNSPRWLIEMPPYNERTDEFLSDVDEHRIIFMGHVHYHINSMNNDFIQEFLHHTDIKKLNKSFEVLTFIVNEFDKGMLEESISTFGPTEYAQQQIDETHAALTENQEKLN